MAPQFCHDCGSILDISAAPNIPCDVCGKTNPNKLMDRPITSTSNNFPSKLRTKLRSHTRELAVKDRESNRRIQVDCQKCDSKEVTWSEMQLRSADEGSTIFYRCPKCGHRWQDNN
ncbi:hypothetical protein I7I53_02132 [Histoplasma capsulatum var. duboisii H88]|nr:hypothetical protein I7I52_04617 [Histoplasma capsulatum]QSS54553.1 hypothetical protein I7I53_02132 [Histoplasma capsulatum var. duboisii H88]QSS74787.1 hypothetical protein I7I50_03710 [Histoplasma capsulatum G186AR]